MMIPRSAAHVGAPAVELERDVAGLLGQLRADQVDRLVEGDVLVVVADLAPWSTG